MNILQCMDDPDLWRRWFRDPQTWQPWRVFLAALFGLPLPPAGRALFTRCTGRKTPPAGGCHEAWLICGRRAGKSFTLALIAVFLAVFRDWSPYLSPGERGAVKIMACDRRQARVIHRYCRALLTEVPALADLVEADTDDEIVLNNNIVIEIQTASFRSIRGYTVIAGLLDEIAFFRSDEQFANPDAAIIQALRPAMATIPGAFLLAASSPYAKRGELWNAYRRWHGVEDAPALVWHASTRTMNPTVPQSVIDNAIERDPDAAEAEFNAQFLTNIQNFISRDVVETLVFPDRFELPPIPGIQYYAFCDPSGGSSDAMTLAIGHRVDETAVIDLVREIRPPFSPAAVTEAFASDLKRYRVTETGGDYYGAEWVSERFRENGITFVRSEKPKSAIYQELLPLLMSGRVELLDHPRAIHQLCSLERRHTRGGKDTIDHPPGGSDDIINAIAGCAVSMTTRPVPMLWDWRSVFRQALREQQQHADH
jgi:hypothetical protein